MTDEAKAAAEIAKTTGKAIDSASKFGEFMARFIAGPLEQLSGIAEDMFKFMRWERQVRLIGRADELLQARGMTSATRAVALKIAVPILQAGSLEESNELQDLWANMLVNAADESVDMQFRRAFISIAEDLTYLGLAEFRFRPFGRANGHDRSMHRQKGVISVLLLEAV
jgi:hypothetical protein